MTVDRPGSATGCRNKITIVFNKLSGKEKSWKVLVDEIHVKPAVRYQVNHIIGFYHDEPTKAARTILAIMIAPMMGDPAFVCRRIPVHSLKHDLILDPSDTLLRKLYQVGLPFVCSYVLVQILLQPNVLLSPWSAFTNTILFPHKALSFTNFLKIFLEMRSRIDTAFHNMQLQ